MPCASITDIGADDSETSASNHVDECATDDRDCDRESITDLTVDHF